MGKSTFGRRQFVACGIAAAAVALPGGVRESRAAGTPLLDRVTVSGFRVSAAQAGNVIGDFVEEIGTERVATALEAALNADLSGIGRGPLSILLSVNVEFVSLARTGLGNTHFKTTVSWSDRARSVIGRLGADPRGARTATAEGELRRLATAYSANMKKMLDKS